MKRAKHRIAFISVIAVLLCVPFSGCYFAYYQQWSGCKYKATEHNLVPDSFAIATYGAEKCAGFAKSQWPPSDSWFRDSVPFIEITFEKKHSLLPFIVYNAEYQRKKMKYGFNFYFHNNKGRIQSVDSLYYTVSDSSTSEEKTGKFVCDKNLKLERSSLNKYSWHNRSYTTSYLLDMHPKRGDVIKGDFIVYYTDIYGRSKMISVNKVRLKYLRIWGEGLFQG
jgi:hypothetical protein